MNETLMQQVAICFAAGVILASDSIVRVSRDGC